MNREIHHGTSAEYSAWLQQQPECVQHLAAEFAIGSTHRANGVVLYVLGHREDDVLIMSPHDPQEDIELALSGKIYICAQPLRTGTT